MFNHAPFLLCKPWLFHLFHLLQSLHTSSNVIRFYYTKISLVFGDSKNYCNKQLIIIYKNILKNKIDRGGFIQKVPVLKL